MRKQVNYTGTENERKFLMVEELNHGDEFMAEDNMLEYFFDGDRWLNVGVVLRD